MTTFTTYVDSDYPSQTKIVQADWKTLVGDNPTAVKERVEELDARVIATYVGGTINANTDETVIATVSIPAGAMGETGMVDGRLSYVSYNNSGTDVTATYGLGLGADTQVGTLPVTMTTGANNVSGFLDFRIANASASVQVITLMHMGHQFVGGARQLATVATSDANDLIIYAQLSEVSGTDVQLANHSYSLFLPNNITAF